MSKHEVCAELHLSQGRATYDALRLDFDRWTIAKGIEQYAKEKRHIEAVKEEHNAR
ncbi:hypothetical protein B0H94_11846 [Salsuginibacillus halophilus]|uniref:Uncharacterized protein n=1 Tax=Salsuginibacillus halophilus TaxID=517424 RepID=A0A2P8H6A3_9BACI|nr:hypothetical protein [Salsuginibacillus halophilus]PSL41733.1 hypothetical protein B0H94_11846 [Salsuginibacillus halophilus]